MKKTMIIPVLLIGLLMTGTSAFAWFGGHGNRNADGACDRRGQGMNYEQHEERMENRLEKMAIILDLSDQQKTQLEQLFEKQWQKRQAMRTELQSSRDALQEYKAGKDFDEADFRAKAQKHADLKTEMMVNRVAMKQQVYSVLTTEQQEKAEKLWDMRGEGMFGKRGGQHNCAGHGQHGKNRRCAGSGNDS